MTLDGQNDEAPQSGRVWSGRWLVAEPHHIEEANCEKE